MPTAITSDIDTRYTNPDIADRSLEYDDAVADFLQDLPLGDDQQNNTAPQVQPYQDEDQEVKVRKARKPVPKLDEERLLSSAGIPRLRKIVKTRVKFRGKGHEFSDISRLLNTYQLWLDDLYPRAKFRDGLTMVEKVGHSKRMQIMRKAWLDETKVGARDDGGEMDVDREEGGGGDGEVKKGGDGSGEDELDALLDSELPGRDRAEGGERRRLDDADDEPNEDELDALLAENSTSAPRNHGAAGRGPFEEDLEEDELDALMNEQASTAPTRSITRDMPHEDDFAAEEEAMAAMGGDW